MRSLGLCVVPLMLAACNQTSGSVQQVAASEPPPASYREQVIARVKKSFFDPYSVRDASISQPFVQNAAFDGVTPIPHSGWMVCIRANAKNRMGAYTGLTETGYMFKGGQIVSADFKGHFCADAKYEPFPEIEEGYRPPPQQPAPRRRG